VPTLLPCEPGELHAALHNLVDDLQELSEALPFSIGLDAAVAMGQVAQQLAGLIDLLDGGDRDA